jgi:hypothetical protein
MRLEYRHMRRRTFVQRALGTGLVAPLSAAGVAAAGQPAPSRAAVPADASTTVLARDGVAERAAWVARATRVADPVLTHLAAGTLRRSMPVEQAEGANRAPVTHLEALGRLLAGLAPWLALPAADTAEGKARARALDLARGAIAQAVDPASADALNFTTPTDRQPLVDAAFLAHAIVRAPAALGDGLDPTTRTRLVAALTSTRAITPAFSNWLLFTAMVEAGLARLGAPWDRTRVDYALRQHAQWYVGDGHYGDGPDFHWDYYNSFVIQPMLLDVLDVAAPETGPGTSPGAGDATNAAWTAMRAPALARARRYAAVQERLIGPDGTFPAIGRSIAYRAGAFQLLAQIALRRALPEGVAPGQARAALSAVLIRTLDAPDTFDANGWLRIGLAGHQPGVGERYISTGSLYLCSTAFLPLGLPPDDPFWKEPSQPWTARLAWSGAPFPIDHAL